MTSILRQFKSIQPIVPPGMFNFDPLLLQTSPTLPRPPPPQSLGHIVPLPSISKADHQSPPMKVKAISKKPSIEFPLIFFFLKEALP